jgi:amino acid adenylation domain-containing protein/non-ribosomal peptide synthase protein (TIGR01720 family)
MTETSYPALENLYGVTPMQEGMLFHAVHDPRGEAYVVQYLLALRGRVDADALRRAWDAVLERHEVLRSAFTWNGGVPRQEVHGGVKLPWESLDWRGVPPAEHGERMEALLAADRARGFDPARPPLLRAILVRTGEEAWKLAWTHHHLVLDGWSAAQVLGEVLALHGAERSGRAPSLPERRPYADYVAWVRERGLEAAEAFWRGALDGVEPTPLPAGEGGGEGHGRAELRLSAVLTARLRSAAREHGLTLNTLLQGAWALLLAHHAGSDDVVFGAVAAGRPAELQGAEEMVGLFVQTQPVRARVRPGVPAAEWLRALQAGAAAAREHEHAPLAEVGRWSGAVPGTPLFESLLAFENYPVDEAAAAESGVEVELEDVVSWTHYPLTLAAIPAARLVLRLKHDRARLDGAGAERLLAHLRTLLEGIAAAPLGPVDALSPLDADERRGVLAEANGLARAFPSATLPALFAAQAARTPGALAVADGRERLTYGELAARAGRVAAVLRARGVGPESRVAVCMERSVDLVAALLGVMRAGGAYVPVDPAYPAERIAFLLGDAGAGIVLVRSGRRPALPEGVEAIDVGRMEGDAGSAPAADAVDPATLAYVIYTSGSTGRPKGVLVEHRSVANLAFALREALPGAGEAPRVSLNGPVTFDTSVKQLVRLAFGGSLHLVPEEARADGAALGAWLRESRVDLFDCTPAQLRLLRAEGGMEGGGPADVLVAGEAIDPALWAGLAEDGMRRYHNLYGPTECTVDVTAARVAGNAPVLGRPLANVRAYVLDARGRPAPAGAPGELYVGGAGVARGYGGRPALTAERFVPDAFSGVPGARLYRTGDRVRRRGDGALEFLGRVDDQVKIRGFRVEPAEVAAALRRHPSVRDAAVVAREHGPGDVRLAAYVVGDAGAEELRRHMRRLVPEHMVPAAFAALDALPLTSHGKLDRRALAPVDAGDDGAGYVAPRTPAEEVLCAVWAEVLDVPRVGVEDDFFALGGHSLLATRVIARVREAFGAEVPLRALLEARTVAALARQVRAAPAADALPPLVPAPRGEPLPLSFAQQRLWFLHQVDPGGSAYNVASALRVRGALEVDAFRRTLDALVERHEVLRTAFPAVAGHPVQRISPPFSVPLPVVDVRGPDAEARVARLAAEESARPFDLAHGPVLRAALLRAGDDEWVVLLTLHHVVHDGWSSGVLIREAAALYDAFAAGRAPALPPLPVQYADYAAWQRDVLDGEALDAQLAWWRGRLAGAPPLLDLPTDVPRPGVQSTDGGRVNFALSPELSGALRAFARREGATLFMTVLAAWQALLARWSGQDDVCVGTPVAGRTRPELEGLVGFFANMLVMRGQLRGGPSLRALVRQAREAVLEAHARQDLPFDRLVDALGVERTLAHAPLFQATLVVQNAGADAPSLGGAPLERLERDDDGAKVDVALELADDGRALAGFLVYRRDLFLPETAARMVEHLQALLAGALGDPELPLDRVPLLAGPERERVLVEWNRTAAEYDRELPFHALFAEWVRRTPDAPAVVCGGETLTYGELDRRSSRLAHHLRALGVGPEARVGVCLERSAALLVAYLGTLKAGGAYVPLDPEFPPDRLSWLLDDSRATVLLTHAGVARGLPPHGARVVRLDADAAEIAACPAEGPRGGATGANLMYLIYTSGSTGRSKGVMVEHRQLLSYLRGIADRIGMPEGGSYAMVSTISADVGNTAIYCALSTGGSLHLIPPGTATDPAALAAHFRRAPVDLLKIVPSHLAALLSGGDDALLPGRCFVLGGEPLRQAWVRELAARAPGRFIVNHYGPTETTVAVLTHPAHEGGAPTRTGTVPLGRPMANVRLYVLGSGGEPSPVGLAGELFIGGTGVSRGYLDRPALTAERYVPDAFSGIPGERLYRTGDRVRWLADGTLEFLGRLDFQVKVRGFRVELGEVEAALLRHPGVREAVVLAPEDGAGQRRLVAYVSGDADAAALREHLRGGLPDYMVPSVIVPLPALPLNANGKVDRHALPDPSGAAGEAEDFLPPATPAEVALAAVWAEVLRVPRVGAGDEFFALGGDSILSIQVVARARAAGWRVTPRQVFENAVLARLAAVAEPLAGDAAPAAAPLAGEVPLLPLQHWFFAHPVGARHHWNQSVLLSPRRPLDPGLLERAFGRVLQHHDALRLRFRPEDGAWRQRCAPADGPVPFERVELAGVEDCALAAAVEARAGVLQASLDLGEGPIVRAAWMELGRGRGARLFITVHHLAVDGVSWRILADDLQSAYAALEAGREAALPPCTASVGEWAARLAAHAAAGGFDGELAYWADPARGDVPPLRADRPVAAGTEAEVHVAAAELDVADTEALLREVPAAYRTRVDVVLLAAAARALAGYAGDARLLVDVEGHGREPLFDDVDLSRTVGWFTSHAPVLLDLRGAEGAGPLLRAVKSQLHAVPTRGVGHGALRWLHPDAGVRARLAALPEPAVRFEYLGQLDGSVAEDGLFAAAPEGGGAERDPRSPRTHPVAVGAAVLGGRLRVTWTLDGRRYRAETAGALAGRFAAELRALLAHCTAGVAAAYAPDDFPLAALTPDGVERLLGSEPGIEDVYPLAPAQEGILFHAVHDGRGGTYVSQLAVELEGPLDAAALQRAWQGAVDRHAALRTGFAWDATDRALQVVRRRAAVPFAVHDWRGAGDGAAEARMAEFLAADRERGFDVAAPPLLRVALFRLADDAWRLVLTNHHLVLDGWSLPLLFADVAELYGTAVAARPPRLRPARPYRDFIAWLAGRDAARTEAFWRAELAGVQGPSELRLPAGAAGAGQGVAELRLEEAEAASLAGFARGAGLTLGTLIHGAWALLLARYTGTDDVVFGTALSGRPAELEGAQETVGLFINTLPARVRVPAGAGAGAWLAGVQAAQARVREVEWAPLASVRRWSPLAPGEPLFDHILVVENYPLGESLDTLEGGVRVHAGAENERNSYPLTLLALPGEGLALRARYDAARFAEPAVERMLGHFRALLNGLAQDTARPLGAIPMLSAAERTRVLEASAGADRAYPAATLHGLVAAQARRTPDAPAVVFEGGVLTYAQLDVAADALAARLRARGVGPEARVAVCLERGPELVVALLAALKAGGAYVPLDPGYPAERLAYMLADSAPAVLLTHSSLAPRLPAHAAATLEIDRPGGAEPALAAGPDADPDGLAYVIYTSGSTGRPKGAMNAHRGIVNRLLWMQEAYGLQPHEAVLQKTPFSFDVSVWEFFWPLVAGARLVLVRPGGHQDPRYLAELVNGAGVTTLHFVPPMLRAFLDEPAAAACGGLRRIVCSGEALPAELRDRCLALLPGAELHNLYGPTEAAVDVTCWPCRTDDGASVPIGLPVANTRAYVAGPGAEPAPAEVPGELLLGGVQVGRGYLGRPALTAERFVPDSFAGVPGARAYRTGDLARRRTDGALEFLGRLDHQVKVRGFRVEPGEVEAALLEHAAVREAAVLARSDGPGEARLVAYVAPTPGAVVDAAALRAHLAELLPAHMVPSAFVFLDALPLSPNGKLDRRALPAPAAPASALAEDAEPRTAAEAALAEIWAQVLRLPRVGVDDDFFLLGGDSILSLQVVSRARRAGMRLTPRDLFEHRTVAALARKAEGPASPEPGLGDGGDGTWFGEDAYPLAPLQEGLLAHLLQAPAGRGDYVTQVAFDVRGALDAGAFRRAWQTVLERHDALRAAFGWEGDRPLQSVRPGVVVPVTMEDWRDTAEADLEARFAAWRADDRRHGFDPARAPLMRVAVLRTGENRYRVVWTHHHILLDGWSSARVLVEVGQAYAAHAAGRAPALPPVRPFRDHVAWVERRDPAEAEAFWRAALEGVEAPTPLGIDRGAAGEPAYGREVLPFSPDEAASLAASSRRLGATPATLVQGAWALLLSRYGGEDDVVFGTTVSGRPAELEGAEEMVGLFINTLPLRVRVSAEARAGAWLAALQRAGAQVREHEHVPLARVQRWTRVPAATPLFESVLVFENYPVHDALVGLDGLEVTPLPAAEQPHTPLTLVAQLGRRPALQAYHRADRIEPAAAARLLVHLRRVLLALAADPDARLGSIPLLDGAERAALLRAAASAVPEAPARTVPAMFREQVRRRPDAVALVHGERRVTYAELDRAARRFARRLAGLGVGLDARVGICVDRSPEMVAAILGTLQAGGAYLPLDPQFPPERLAFMLADADAGVLVTQGALADRFAGFAGAVVLVDDGATDGADGWMDGAAEEGHEPGAGLTPDHLAYVMYTSGSTGLPKGTEVPHRAIPGFFRGVDYVRFDEDQVLLQYSSPSWDVLTLEMWPALLTGGTCVLYPGRTPEPEELRRQVRTHGVTTLWLTSAFFNSLVDGAPEVLEGVRQVMVGGEAVSTPHVRRAQALFPALRLVNGYGPSECTVFASCYPIPAGFAGSVVPIGTPVGDRRVYALDRFLEPVPAGVPGELYVGGPAVARGYVRRPLLTAERFVPDPFSPRPGARLYRTGDRVRWRGDGTLEFVGRVDQQVKLRGFRVEPGEVEHALCAHPAVREAVVMAREDAPGQKRLVAYVVPAAGETVDARALGAWLRERLPEPLVPSAVVALDALPLNANGKVDKRALPVPSAPEGDEAFAAPRTEAEDTLAAIWAGVLGVERVGVDDVFFELGGDSILTFQVVSRARRAGLPITARQLYENPTVAGLARVAALAAETRAEQGAVTGEAPLTPIQHWFFELDLAHREHWNQALLLRPRRPLDPRRLDAALARLLAHHDALRLRFARGAEGGWTQGFAPAEGQDAAVPLHLEDLSALPSADAAREMEAACGRLQASMDLEAGPLFRAALFDLGAAGQRLLLAIHHLAVDGVSWRVLLEDLEAALDAAEAGAAPGFSPKTTSYRRWAVRLAEHAASAAMAAEAAYWAAAVPADAPALPVDHSGGDNRVETAGVVTAELDEGDTRALLQEVPPVYRTRVDEALLAALARAFGRWTGEDRLLVDLEGHGREDLFSDVDLTRTVGWFTSIYPVLLDLRGAPGEGDALRAVKEQLRAVPGRGVGYGILRWLSPDAGVRASLRALPAPQVAFHYLGQADSSVSGEAAFARAPEPTGPTSHPRGSRRAHLLEVNALVEGGRLRCSWAFNEGVHRRETVERLARGFITELRALVEHCRDDGAGGYTPSDFALAGIDAATLAMLESDLVLED